MVKFNSSSLVKLLFLFTASLSHSLALNFQSKKLSAKQEKSKSFSTEIIPKDYKVPVGFLLSGVALTATPSPGPAFGAFIFLVGAFLTVQTGKIIFVFDNEALEVMVKKNSDSEIEKTRENFAVGGRNRWKYSSVTEWGFFPSSQLPILCYFKETETDTKRRNAISDEKEGQFHLFPVIMNAKKLSSAMEERIGMPGKRM